MADRHQRSKRKRNKNKKLLKQFSTLSEGTLHSPSLSLCLELVSKLYLRHILLRDGCVESRRDVQWEEKFDVDNFLAPRYNTYMIYPCIYIGGPIIFKQEFARSQLSIPTFEIINNFLIGIFQKLHLNVESSIVSLIYTERLMDMRHISLTPRNWRPILIASILTASKVWDDLSSWNIEFSNLLPILSLTNINKLEGLYLQALQYDLYISSSEYAKYYFALRGLKNTKTENIPRYYLNMKIAKKNKNKNKNKNPNKRKTSHSASVSTALNMSMSQRARNLENKSIMDHANNIIKLDNLNGNMHMNDDQSMVHVEEQKYDQTGIIHISSHNHNNNNNDMLTNSMLSQLSSLSNINNDDNILTSSSESNQSNNSINSDNKSCRNGYNNTTAVIKEEEEEEEEEKISNNIVVNNSSYILDNNYINIKRSKGILLKPKQATNKPSTTLPCSMPTNIKTLRPING